MKAGTTVSTAPQALRRLYSVQAEGVRTAAKEIAELLERYAKTHHAWKRDTGETDDTTEGTVEEAEEIVWVILSSDSPHSKYLELARAGKWAWLRPTVDANLATIQAILAKHVAGSITAVAFESTAEF